MLRTVPRSYRTSNGDYSGRRDLTISKLMQAIRTGIQRRKLHKPSRAHSPAPSPKRSLLRTALKKPRLQHIIQICIFDTQGCICRTLNPAPPRLHIQCQRVKILGLAWWGRLPMHQTSHKATQDVSLPTASKPSGPLLCLASLGN